MILEQHYLGCLAQASYFLVDESSRHAAVIDPRRDVDLYLERAAHHSATITAVFLTHFHADFLAGHLELAERTGAKLYLGAQAKADFDAHLLADTERVDLGPEVSIETWHTPGHTPESVCYLIHEAGQPGPAAVFTGDTLFIGDVGRPDLMTAVGVTAEELAGQMYDSLARLQTLPDESVIYPGHGAGSPCGKNLSDETFATLGNQKATNYALQPQPREEFVAALTAGQPPAPPYFPRTARLNQARHGLLDDVLGSALAPLSLEQVRQAGEAGATLLDARSGEEFASGHLPGSVHIGLDGNFASWCGRLLDLEAPIVLITAPGEEREAAVRLGRVGLDQIAGFLSEALPSEGLVSQPRVDPANDLESATFLDVRFPGEVESERIPGTQAIPLQDLAARTEELPRSGRVLIHCKTGYRSLTASSLLRRLGFEEVVDVQGGIEAWKAKGLPVEGGGC